LLDGTRKPTNERGSLTGLERPLSIRPDPDLIVRIPPGSREEREYIARVVLTDWLGLEIAFEQGPAGSVGLRVPDAAGPIVSVPDLVFGSTDTGWRSAILPRKGTCQFAPLDTLLADGRSLARQVPLLFGGSGLAAEDADGGLVVGHDVFGVAFFYLAGCDDFLATSRDSFDRQLFNGSFPDLTGTIDEPVVDYLVDHLWLILSRSVPRLRRRRANYRPWVTHDVDHMLSWMSLSSYLTAHAIVGDLVRRRSPGLAVRRGLSRLRHSPVLQGLDPYDTFEFLMDASEGIGARSSFFFLLGGPSPVDYANDVTSASARRLFARIRERGHEIGLHGSAASNDKPGVLREQLFDLWSAAGASGSTPQGWGGRQHYLTWNAPATWRAWAAAGLAYDSSVAFQERAGFRAGTCRPFPAFDLERREQLQIEERPLVIMDGTLWVRMGLSRRESMDLSKRLAERCRESAGTLTLLWHNSFLTSRRDRSWYLELLDAVRP